MKFIRVFVGMSCACCSEFRIFVTRIFDGVGVSCTRVWRHSTLAGLEVTLPEVYDSRCPRVCVRSIVTASLRMFGHSIPTKFPSHPPLCNFHKKSYPENKKTSNVISVPFFFVIGMYCGISSYCIMLCVCVHEMCGAMSFHNGF